MAKQQGEEVGQLLCECGEECTVRRCKSEKETYFTSCGGCHSRRFISPALLKALDKQKLLFDR
ncbi:MAG: hypothetical protein AAB262_11870 [Elusimicrobiota bacterium]